MRILILTQWYKPEPVQILQELAQTFIQFGHQVEVLTGFPNYPSGSLYPGYRLRLCQRELIEGVPVTRVPLYPNHSRSGILRMANYLSFGLSAALFGLSAVERPDVIFVWHPPLTVGIPAIVLSQLWRVPFVYQVQDLWPETLSATGMLNNKLLLGWIGKAADLIYRQASAICVISPGFRVNLLAKGVPSGKLHFIPNWADLHTYPKVDPDPELAKVWGLEGRFNVMFAGNIGEAQGLQVVVEAAKLLQDEPSVQFVLVGDGTVLPRLHAAVSAAKLGNVRFLGHRPVEDMPALYALADVLLVHLRDDPLFGITIPHKILGYLASSKPIIAAVGGDAAQVVEEAGAGLTCQPENPEALEQTVRQFMRMTPAERRGYGERGLDAAKQHYHREVVLKRTEAVLLSVVNPGSRRQA